MFCDSINLIHETFENAQLPKTIWVSHMNEEYQHL